MSRLPLATVVLFAVLVTTAAGCRWVKRGVAGPAANPEAQQLLAAIERLDGYARPEDEGGRQVLLVQFRGGGPKDSDLADLRPLIAGAGVPVHLNLNQCHDITDAGVAHLAGLDNLVGLGLGDTKVTDAGLAQVATLANLEELYASNDRGLLTDAGLAHLRGLTKLRRLSVYSDQITDAGYAPLSGLTALEELHAGPIGMRLGDTALGHIRGLTQLREVSVGGDRLTDAGMADLGQLTGLRKLRVFDAKVTAAGLAHLSALTALDDLTIVDCRAANGDGLAALDGLTSLQSININGCGRLSSAAVGHLGKPTGLRKLEVDWVDPTSLGGLRGLTGLEELVFQTQVPFGDAGIEPLAGLTSLKELHLSGAGITDAGLKPLAGLTALTDLRLDGNPIRGPGLQHLAGMTALRYLSLARCRLTGPGLEHLSGMAPDQLRLDENPITDAGLEHLKGLGRVKQIYLGGTKTTDNGCLNLKQAIPEVQLFDYASTEVTLGRRRSATAEPVEDLSAVPPALTVTADTLDRDFRADRAAAGKKYEGVVVVVGGVVQDIDRGWEGQPYVTLKVAGDGRGVTCFTADARPWARVVPGQTIRLKGRGPHAPLSPTLLSCVILAAGPSPALTAAAEQLSREFTTDPQGSAKKYDQKYLVLTGRVADRSFDGLGAATINLTGNGKVRIRCEFGGNEREDTRAMKPGDEVKVVGQFLDFADGTVRLSGCLSVRQP